MAKTFKIIKDNNNVEALIDMLSKTKETIKEVFCAVRFTDGSLTVLDLDVPFESLCTISKKLDLLIDFKQQPEEEEFEDDLEEDEE